MSYLGAIEDIGQSPYKIAGDPVTALVAQLNRFAGKTVNPGGSCGTRKIVSAPFPLIPTLDQRGATAAMLIVWTRWSCVPAELWSKTKEEWAAKGLFEGNTWSFVMNNLAEVTTTIAQFGDAMGLDAASTGITTRDPKMTPKFPTMTVVLLGALAVAAVLVTRRKK